MEVLCEHKFSRHTLWQLEAQLMRIADWRLDPPTAFTMARDLVAALDPLHHCAWGDMDVLMALLQSATEGENSFSIVSMPATNQHASHSLHVRADYASLRFDALTVAIAAVFVLTSTQDRGVSTSLAVALSSLDARPLTEMVVECCQYMLDLPDLSIQGGAALAPKLLATASDAGSRSPNSVDTDHCFYESECSSTWMVELRACLEAAALLSQPLGKRHVVDTADGARRALKRMRSN